MNSTLHDKLLLELQETHLEADRFHTRCKYQPVLKEIRNFDKSASLRSASKEYHPLYNKVVLQIKEEGKPKLTRVRPLSWTRWFNWKVFGTDPWKPVK